VAARVVVFIDYQNVYRNARTLFHGDAGRHHDGQISPLPLAQHLAEDSPFDRELREVRVYRGQPDATRDPKGYSASRHQHTAWAHPQVALILRTLLYPRGWPHTSAPGERPQEKGIDVALAIDFALMAVRDEYDVGILMSTDTDLKPALEVVSSMTNTGGPRAEVAAWSGANRHSPRLSIAGRALWCHWLDKSAYERVRDPTDYS